MPKTVYVDFSQRTELQTNIMKFVDWWVRAKKTPVSRKAIVNKMTKMGVKEFTTINSINGLVRWGFLRPAIMRAKRPGKETFYVQLRRV